MKLFMSALLFISTQVMGATIAVIDSGVDIEHKDLLTKLWVNSAEVADNGRDEDKNGYQDDVNGWNFAEQNNLVIDRKYIGTFSQDPYKFFEIQGKMFLNRASEAEVTWLKEKVQDAAFLKEMQIFGNFVHGTHVAGITANENSHAKVIAVKLIPTEVKPILKKFQQKINSKNIITKDFRIKLLKQALIALADQQMLMLEEIAFYVGNHGADIANGSFGTGFNQARMITDTLFKIIMFRKPKPAESEEMAMVFLNSLVSSGKAMVDAAPKTLFVFAAGNDGMNNDKYPTSPTNIIADNVISVAATYKYNFIAPFSNYGEKMVDVAAPGMLIRSQIPGNLYLEVSGTSQAAPYVANLAAQIKDINNALTPKQIKKILMRTVDEKEFLALKVKSKGIVNLQRATYAAELSLDREISAAILQANINVADVVVDKDKTILNAHAVTPIPLVQLFK